MGVYKKMCYITNQWIFNIPSGFSIKLWT